MCLCTQYDSPTCGHTWISMSQPCGLCRDLLNCPQRQIHQALIAPPLTCPQCNGGFADAESIQMIQGPWGCNQMIRSHLGGNQSVPGAWGNARLSSQQQSLVLGDWCVNDHGHTNPLGGLCGNPVKMAVSMPVGMTIANPNMNERMICGGYRDARFEDAYWGYDDNKRRRRKSHHYYKYRRSTRSGSGCIVM